MPLDVLRPVLSPQAVDALRAAGHSNLETVTRMSAREVAVLVGADARDAIGIYLRSRGVAWGARAAR